MKRKAKINIIFALANLIITARSYRRLSHYSLKRKSRKLTACCWKLQRVFFVSSRFKEFFLIERYCLEKKKLTAGFFFDMTLKVKNGAMETQRRCRLRDDQEKYIVMMKGIMGADRQLNRLEGGRTGRSFVLFVAQILGCSLSSIGKTKLKGRFDPNPGILNEMHLIRYVEHEGLRMLAGRPRPVKPSDLISLKAVCRNMRSEKPTRENVAIPERIRWRLRILRRKN